jgi:hypothetical protein
VEDVSLIRRHYLRDFRKARKRSRIENSVPIDLSCCSVIVSRLLCESGVPSVQFAKMRLFSQLKFSVVGELDLLE